MQFIVQGFDGNDEQALDRRAKARQAHLDQMKILKESGTCLYAAAFLDDDKNLCGSMLVLDFTSREELDSWLEKEPYVQGGVWEEVLVNECKIPPSFLE